MGLLPRHIVATLKNYKILSAEFGQWSTMRQGECVDANGVPIPWYTYPAIEYLRQLDLTQKAVFEYGSGNSTRFWAARSRKLVSVEDDREWFRKVSGLLPRSVEYLLLEGANDYITSIHKFPDHFDIIIVDGSHRYECAVEALKKLQPDGFVILDNADWKDKTAKLLRDADLIEVDMAGFGPINGYTWTTSFFFGRNVRLMPAHDRQPAHGIGSIHLHES